MTNSDDRDEFLQIYLEEGQEETEKLGELLLELEQNPENMEALREAFRLLHTFKGATGMMGFDRINGLAHELETRFDACRNQRERLTTETISLTLQCVDYFGDFLQRLSKGNEDQGDPQPLMEALARLGSATPSLSETVDGDAQETKIAISETGAEDQPDRVDAASMWNADTRLETATTPPDHEPIPVVEPTPVDEAGPVHGVTLRVRLSEHIELPELKARLVIARLQAHGEILGIDPPLELLDQAKLPITLRVRLRTTSDESVLVDSIDVDGVDAAYVAESESDLPTLTGESSRKISTTPADHEAETSERRESGAQESKDDALPSKAVERAAPARVETIRVGIDRLDRLMNLAGELVVTNARFDQLSEEIRLLFRRGGSIEAGSPLAQSLLRALGGELPEDYHASSIADSGMAGAIGVDGASSEDLSLRKGWMERGRRVAGQVSETVDQLARLSRSIQQAVLETRMVPIGPLFNRFRRTIRDLSLKQGKSITLKLEGESTELDRRMVDELGDPMVHLIRNAIDHGIESAEERTASGKPAEGHIRLGAYHQSNHVVIEISDDGGGVDVAKVRSRAVQRGLASEAEVRGMTDREVYGFIWHPGFSTADQISDISGRGVGMDVVRDRIAALGGLVEFDSQAGIGSTVSVRLPLTLAIVNALIVRFRGFRFAIPVTDVVEIFGASRTEVFESQGRDMIDVRGKLLPLYRLDELFAWNDSLPPAEPRPSPLVNAVLVRDGHRFMAIEVDDLDGNSDIVIKPLNDHFQNIKGLGGACVMGDGDVCLVLDTTQLTPVHRSALAAREA